ncbi:hypothetical protein FCM35_KLT20723 [Carex littledalei]|uniref:Uncharacterized protein n=1 Tax=Carex littledalei TaxID=544730 RepID=A0A833R2K9_9POAL|nr:hypothetical protein FCM35_KLT20723 [Carex littledalei]
MVLMISITGWHILLSKLGEPSLDGKTDTNSKGLTAAFGNWAPAVAARLHNNGLSCKLSWGPDIQVQPLVLLKKTTGLRLCKGGHELLDRILARYL